jgi:hypothetical protein
LRVFNASSVPDHRRPLFEAALSDTMFSVSSHFPGQGDDGTRTMTLTVAHGARSSAGIAAPGPQLFWNDTWA